jgi:hypothetical protein
LDQINGKSFCTTELTLVMEEWREVPHGGLLHEEHELVEASFDAYEETAGERWI